MGDDDERAVVVLQRLGQRLAHLDVEVVGRLVEDQQVRPLPHQQRQREPRLLAAGKAPDRRAHHVAAEIEAAEEVAQLLLARRRLEPRQVPQRRLVRAQLLDLVLGEVADLQRLRGEALARARRERPGDALQQRRLARAVGAEEADAVAGEDRPRHAGEHRRGRRRVAVAQRHVLEAQELPRVDRRRLEVELERAVDVRRGDPLHPLQRLDPALRLLRLGRLRLEAVDERLQVRDLLLLLGVARLLQRQLQRALLLELRVVAAVGLQLLRVDVDDAVDDAVEEVAIVRDQQQRARVAAEPVLEPQHRVEVEVVGRLVEQQQVRARHQRLREVEPHPPAAGEARHRVRLPRLGESPAPTAASRRARGPRSRRSPRTGGAAPPARSPPACGSASCAASAAAIPRSTSRSSRSPSSTKSIAAAATDGVSCATCAIVQAAGSSTLPASGRSSPRISANRLDLPQPLGPISPTLWPVDGQRRPFEQALGAAGEREVGQAQHRGRRSATRPGRTG